MQTPSDQWQSRARKYLEEAVCHLWAAEGHRWAGWLKEIRGLNEVTVRTYQLGLQPIDRWEERESWGLESVMKDNGRRKKLWLPEGLVIPYFIGDQISQISFRRKKSADGPRYLHLEGSQSHPMVLQPQRDILIMVESALDGFLLDQEAGGLAGVVILGSAQGQPDKELAALLRSRRLLLLALDADAAGARGHRWWLEHFPNSRRWPPIRGKDPGEMLKQGIDLRLWIEVGISHYLDEIAKPEEEGNDLCPPEAAIDNEPQTENIRLFYKEEVEPKPQAPKHEFTCFECGHFSPAEGSPNPTQAWGFCRERNRGRYGVAAACEAALYRGGCEAKEALALAPVVAKG